MGGGERSKRRERRKKQALTAEHAKYAENGMLRRELIGLTGLMDLANPLTEGRAVQVQ